MEEKNVGKFLNYVKKFLTMSFLSALATVAFSCFSVTMADGDLTDSGPDDQVSESYSGSDPVDEIDQKEATVKNKVAKFRNGDSWQDIFNRVQPSTHDSSGNKLPGCTGYWMIKGYNGTLLYNERSNYTKMTPTDYYQNCYNKNIFFIYYEGNDDLYSNDEKIEVKLKNLTRNYLITSSYKYDYTISGNEKVAKDIDPNSLVKNLEIIAYDEFRQPVTGTWSWEDPNASVNDYLSDLYLVFKPSDKDYNDLNVRITILNLGKEETHSAVKDNDVIQNVSPDGTTSAIKKSSGITWVNEESGGTSAWYGFEDPNNVLPEGTRLSVKWDDLDKDSHWDIFNMFASNGLLPEKVWRFNLQALSPNNELIHYFDKPLNIYIELGEDWDKDEIVGLYAKLENKIKENWDIRYEDIVIDGKKRTFAVLSPTHFSEYYLADNTTGKDIYEKIVTEAADKLKKWTDENPDATKKSDEVIAQYKKILEELTSQLNDQELEAFTKYVDSLDKTLPSEQNQPQTASENTTPTTTATTTATTTKSSTSSSSKNSAGTKTGVGDYSNLISFLSLGSLAGIGSCLKKKKD